MMALVLGINGFYVPQFQVYRFVTKVVPPSGVETQHFLAVICNGQDKRKTLLELLKTPLEPLRIPAGGRARVKGRFGPSIRAGLEEGGQRTPAGRSARSARSGRQRTVMKKLTMKYEVGRTDRGRRRRRRRRRTEHYWRCHQRGGEKKKELSKEIMVDKHF